MSDWERINSSVGPALLRRTTRRTLAISVLPNGALELIAPARAPMEDILGKVAKRRTWIERQRRRFVAMNDKRTARRYVNGATHRYLGRQYRLKVKRGSEPGVRLSGAYFHVISRTGSEHEVEDLLNSWMRHRASEQFIRRVAKWESWCAHQKLPKPKVVLRSMSKRWGSAHKNGQIVLNPELVRAPSVCIDYVVAHEVCHLQHPDHGPMFYRLLDRVFPIWRLAKERLESTN